MQITNLERIIKSCRLSEKVALRLKLLMIFGFGINIATENDVRCWAERCRKKQVASYGDSHTKRLNTLIDEVIDHHDPYFYLRFLIRCSTEENKVFLLNADRVLAEMQPEDLD